MQIPHVKRIKNTFTISQFKALFLGHKYLKFIDVTSDTHNLYPIQFHRVIHEKCMFMTFTHDKHVFMMF